MSESTSHVFINSLAASMDENKTTLESKCVESSENISEDVAGNQETLPDANEDINSEICKGENDEWLDIMGSGNFKKKIIKPGLGHGTRPSRGDRVTVDVLYYVNNISYEESKDLKFIVGDLDVIQGLDLVICLMEKGEKAKVIIPPKLAYGTVGLSPNVPPNSEIECDIELKDVEQIDEASLSVSERLHLGNTKKLCGNFFYDRAQYIDAIHCYERAIEYLDGIRDCSGNAVEELQEVVNIRLRVYNNMAASHLKLSAYSAALKSLESVLKVQPKNIKALYRKGKILGLQGSTDEAIACMKAAANLEPETKIIQAELIRLINQKKREEEKQKAMYKRMFKNEPKEKSTAISWVKKWSVISCGVLAVAVGSAFAYRNFHS